MSATRTPCFSPAALAAIGLAYPGQPALLEHGLTDHPLLRLHQIALLAERMDPADMEYNRSDIPIGISPDAVQANGLSIGDTIRSIAANKSWAVLKWIEKDPAYAGLLRDLLSEVAPLVERRTGPMLNLQGFIFISSPNSVTPYHFDPEHNILLQLQGSKTMYAYPAGDTRYAAQQEHERYHAGGHRNLPWREEFAGEAFEAQLTPGKAVLMPVMAPHYVVVGPEPSLSLSITWRSEWSYREAEAHAANRWLRRRGLSPAMPPRWPQQARLKTLGWRVGRKLGLVG